jgi:hypothetical protein
MPRLISSALAAALAIAGSPAAAEISITADPGCTVVRILPSGRRVVTPPNERPHRRGPAHATASASGAGSASASASSYSSSDGPTSASATSKSGRPGRTVTTTQDNNGCTVVIDDRRSRGARR